MPLKANYADIELDRSKGGGEPPSAGAVSPAEGGAGVVRRRSGHGKYARRRRDEIRNISQIVICSSRAKHTSRMYAFTEQGVAMLSDEVVDS